MRARAKLFLVGLGLVIVGMGILNFGWQLAVAGAVLIVVSLALGEL
jgi:hypothetical protein